MFRAKCIKEIPETINFIATYVKITQNSWVTINWIDLFLIYPPTAGIL